MLDTLHTYETKQSHKHILKHLMEDAIIDKLRISMYKFMQ